LLPSTARVNAEDPAHGNSDVVFTVSGRLEAHNISELSALLAAGPDRRPRVLDLKDVVLVDGDVPLPEKVRSGQHSAGETFCQNGGMVANSFSMTIAFCSSEALNSPRHEHQQYRGVLGHWVW
jgi:hypothetical protein